MKKFIPLAILLFCGACFIAKRGTFDSPREGIQTPTLISPEVHLAGPNVSQSAAFNDHHPPQANSRTTVDAGDRAWGERISNHSNGIIELNVYENGICQVKMAEQSNGHFTKEEIPDWFVPLDQTNWPRAVSIKIRQRQSGEIVSSTIPSDAGWFNPCRHITSIFVSNPPVTAINVDTDGLDLDLLRRKYLNYVIPGGLPDLSGIDFKLLVVSRHPICHGDGSPNRVVECANFESDWLPGKYLKSSQ